METFKEILKNGLDLELNDLSVAMWGLSEVSIVERRAMRKSVPCSFLGTENMLVRRSFKPISRVIAPKIVATDNGQTDE